MLESKEGNKDHKKASAFYSRLKHQDENYCNWFAVCPVFGDSLTFEILLVRGNQRMERSIGPVDVIFKFISIIIITFIIPSYN